jgi:hypothetical protein
LSIERLGWESKVFRVIAWKFSQEGGIDLVVKEEASSVYDWNAGDETENDPAPDTELASPFTVEPPTDLTVSFTADSNRLMVSWTASVDPFVFEYQVEYITFDDLEASPSLTWTVLPRTSGTRLDVGNLLPDIYVVRVKAINSLGVSSEYVSEQAEIDLGYNVDTYPAISSIIANVWTEQSNPQRQDLKAVCWGVPSGTNGLYVAVGVAAIGSPTGDSYIATSPDGITWTERANPQNVDLYGVIFAGGQFVAVGEVTTASPSQGSYILTSPDGATWTQRSNPGNQRLRAIAYGEPTASPTAGIYVAVGDNASSGDSLILTSPDGITWTERANPVIALELQGVCWTGELFVAVGQAALASPTEGAYVITSADGITWTTRTNPENVNLTSVASNGRGLVVAVGDYNSASQNAYIIGSSDGGITWEELEHQSQGASTQLNGIVWNGSIFVAVGNWNGSNSDAFIATSADGLVWSEKPNPKQSSLSGVCWNGNAFLAVGVADGTDAYIIKSLQIS